jgi:hypothetical protein
MSVRGVFASHSGIVGERQRDLAARVLMLGYAGTAPLLALSAGMPKRQAVDTAFSWTEDSHISGNTTADGAALVGATTITVHDTNIWVPNTVVMNQSTGEHMLITDIAGEVITVIRGISGTSAAAVTDGDIFQSIGTAFEEGGSKPTPVTQKGETRTNYVQIFKNGWAVTGTATAIGYVTGSQLANNRSNAFAYHAEDIERAFLFGKPGVFTVNNKQMRLSAGILHQIENYGGFVESAAVGAVAGDMSLGFLRNWLRQIFDRNVKGLPNERICFTGSAVVELISQMAKLDSVYNIQVNETSWGFKIMKIIGFNGDLTLATHPMMVENSIWGQELYVLHPGLIGKRQLRDTWQEEFGWNTNNNGGEDATEGFIADELGFEVKAVETMGIMRNIQTAVAST